ncbi:MAG TPA: alpha/beta fold hydrolase [Bryobacteraceae bacterium]|jgi:alpha/beta superfamily hydrolase|nr:alpha/beta fold hydrolase [Bryobacteraceae bacterium]
MPRRIESLFVAGPAGRLEALLEEPEDLAPREIALVCHPHPQHGGTMHNKVVYRIARGLRRAGAVVLRFNYRGVNLSEGTYDHGEGELDDARACLAYLRERYPALPVTLAGFSFGSRIVLRLGCGSGEARRIIAAGFPSIFKDRSYLDNCTVPRIFVQSTHDQYGPLAEIEPIVATLPEPKRLILIEAQDHFFAGGLEQLEEAIAGLH